MMAESTVFETSGSGLSQVQVGRPWAASDSNKQAIAFHGPSQTWQQNHLTKDQHNDMENLDQNLADSLNSQQNVLPEPQDGGIDDWNPMDEDFANPQFNCYKNFDILKAEDPRERSPEKSIRQSPDNREEEVSIYIGNIPLSITNEGIRNLFSNVGVVQHCAVFPPKDPSYDTKYGFVKFSTWREAIKVIEEYDGFYVGREKNLIVRVAHRRHETDEIVDYKDFDNNSPDETGDDQLVNNHLQHEDNNKFDDEEWSSENHELIEKSLVNVGRNQDCVSNSPNCIDHENLEKPSSKVPNIVSSDSSGTAEMPHKNEATVKQSGSTRPKYPCTNCKKLCTKRCSECKAPYCSRKCQKEDKARHKLICTYAGFKKPELPKQVTVEPYNNIETDSDFDCIDISIDATTLPARVTSDKDSESGKELLSETLVDSLANEKEDSATVLFERFEESKTSPEGVMCDSSSKLSNDEISQSFLDKEFVAYVSATFSSKNFWAVPRTLESQHFCELTARTSNLTEENLEKLKVFDIGDLCLTRFSVDNCWYRARIDQYTCGKIRVIFIDYGNVELKDVGDLYELPSDFNKLSPQAKQFSLYGVDPTLIVGMEHNLEKLLENLICGKTFLFELVSSSPNSIPQVILKERGSTSRVSVNEKINSIVQQYSVDSQLHKCAGDSNGSLDEGSNSVVSKISDHQQRMASEVLPDVLPSSKSFDVFICHFVDPSLFWVWFIDTARSLFSQLSTMLSAAYEDSSYTEFIPFAGELIAAKFTDETWYRASVDVVNTDSTVFVTFIDFGNSETVLIQDTRRITESLASFPKLATKCSLYGAASSSTNYSKECVQFVSNMVLNKSALATFKERSKDALILHIEMLVNGEMCSVHEEMMKAGYVARDSLVTHGNDGPITYSTYASREELTVDGRVVSCTKKEIPLSDQSCHVMPSDSISTPSTAFENGSVRLRNESPPIADASVLTSLNDYTSLNRPKQADQSKQLCLATRKTQIITKPLAENTNSMPLLRPPIVSSSPFDVVVSSVVSADEFFVQIIDDDSLCRLHEQVRSLNEYVSMKELQPVKNASSNNLGCAKFKEDEIWYRAQIIQIQNERYTIRFIDFGNTQVVSSNEFLEIPESFFQFPPLSLCCRLGSRHQIWGKHSREFLEKLSLEKRLSCIVLPDSSESTFCVKLQYAINGEVVDIAEELNKDMAGCPPLWVTQTSGHPSNLFSCALPSSSKSQETTQEIKTRFNENILSPAILASGIRELGQVYEIKVTCSVHPHFYWVQNATNIARIQVLQDELKKHYMNSNRSSYKPAVGSFCCFVDGTNNNVYRVYVKSQTPEGFVVHSVDFGFQILLQENSFRPLEEKFRSQAIGAVLCSLDGVAPLYGMVWSNEAKLFFGKKVTGNILKARLVYISKTRLFLDVYDRESRDEVALSKLLVSFGFAKELVVAEGATCDIAGSQETYVPLAQTKVSPTQGNVHPAKANVSPIHGNSPSAHQLSSIGDNLYESQRCNVTAKNKEVANFHQPKVENGYHSDVDEKLTNIMNNNLVIENGVSGSTSIEKKEISVFTLSHNKRMATSAAKNETHLCFNGTSSTSHQSLTGSAITLDTSTICVSLPTENEIRIFVSWVDSPNCFWAQLAVSDTAQAYAKMGEQLNANLRNLHDKLLDVAVGGCYASLFDGEWCRCKVEAIYENGCARILYVDFGNRETVDIGSLRVLSKDFKVMSAQAFKCGLAGVKAGVGGWREETSHWFRTYVMNKTFRAVTVGSAKDVLLVDLYNSQNVSVRSIMRQFAS